MKTKNFNKTLSTNDIGNTGRHHPRFNMNVYKETPRARIELLDIDQQIHRLDESPSDKNKEIKKIRIWSE